MQQQLFTTFRESKLRSLFKSVSWRVWGTLTTVVIAYFVTGSVESALAIGGLEVLLKLIFYFYHERAWNAVNYGQSAAGVGAASTIGNAAGVALGKPFVLWFTGLPSAGKSTLAQAFADYLRSVDIRVEHLDGDAVRAVFPSTGFSAAERNHHVRQMGFLASLIERQGSCVVASFVSPYRESRQFARESCRGFIEIHVAASLAECESRDVKGLYRKARAGEIKNFTGLDDPYEPPLNPEIVLDTGKLSVETCLDEIGAYLHAQGYLLQAQALRPAEDSRGSRSKGLVDGSPIATGKQQYSHTS